MKGKHKKVLDTLFADPVNSNIPWKDIEALLNSLGAEITEGKDSRVRLALNSKKAVFHRPQPKKETDKGAVVSMRRFLRQAGVHNVEI